MDTAMTERTIAPFQISTDEDFRFQYVFANMDMSGRSLRVIVKERATNTTRATLTIGSGLTLTGTDTVTGSVVQSTSSAWPRGEYEVDLHDITGGSNTRIVAGRAILDLPGNLVYGVRGNKATVTMVGNQAVVTAIGGIGPPGPANSLEIGTVDTLETGQAATAEITGTAPAQVLNLGLPKGNTGDKGWTPELAVVSDGARRVHQVVDWFGGEGAKPAVGDYVGPAGLVAAIGDANDIRGGTGATGATGDPGTDGTNGADGNDGWTPELAVVTDVNRRVLQVVDWTGGEGTKPATGLYVGATGLVVDIASAVDIRGDQGPPGSVADGDKGDITVSDGGTTWSIDPGAVGTTELADGAVEGAKIAANAVSTAKIADDAVTFAKMQNVGTGRFIGRKTAGTGDAEELTPDDAETISGGATARLFPAGSAAAPGVIPVGDANTGLWSPGADTLAWSTAGSERLRLLSGGSLVIGGTAEIDGSGYKVQVQGPCSLTGTTGQTPLFVVTSGSGSQTVVQFRQGAPAATCGSITVNSATSTSYNTSSDYRLKENVVRLDLDEAMATVSALKPSRFNFIAAPSVTVDGFIAHEVDEAAPFAHAVAGEKDGDDMQGLDPGKLIATLTAGLQWAIREIERLKSVTGATSAE